MTLRDLMSIRDVRLLLVGQGLSWVGDAFNPIALSVAVVLSGGGAGELGIIFASGVVARLLCTLVGGVWADRVTPHRIMVVADLVRAASVGATAVAFAALGDPPVAVLAGLAAVTSGAGAFFFPAFVSLRPLIVPGEGLQSANAAISFLQSSAQMAGPVLAGVVVAAFGSVPGFAVNALTFAWSAACVARLRARSVPGVTRSRMLTEVREGLGEIRSRDWLWTGLVSAGMFHVASGVFVVLVEVTVVRDLGGAHALGLVTAALGVGGLVGGLVALRVQPRRMLLWAFVSLALFPLFPVAFAWSGGLWTVMALGLVAQAGLLYFDVGWQTAVQQGVPHDRLARVASWDVLISFVALPVGNVLAGPLSGRFATPDLMGGIAAWMLLAGCWPLLVRSVRGLTRGGGAPSATTGGEGAQPSAAIAAS
ncbi:MFS transporter [Terrabacter aerolatus]|uniref:MFS transporter n=1 Tax=Terrabacter aerolatus TaxID=422442 RepID=A0A512CZ41_9MICO|nr:MFS transporter [Terrabacter aerolatus]GEO29496.1 MFS transporter [Terrabacter aerolatus]